MRQKRKIALVVLAALLVLVSLASCNTGNGDKPDTEQPPSGNIILPPKENLIFSQKTIPNVICNDQDTLAKVLEDLSADLLDVTGKTPPVYTDQEYEAKHEIVIGETDREISKTAYRFLERLDHEEEGNVGYLIYSDGSSIAIAFDKDRYQINAAAARAIEDFAKDIEGKTEVIIPKGVYASASIDALDYQQQIDDADTAEEWIIFENAVNTLGADGKAITNAVKDYYTRVCTDNVISWFANLYDPAIGGYYFSNSARNTPGYLPDSESTQQALGQFKSSGMFENVNPYSEKGYGLYMNGLPEWFRAQIVRFLKSLQDPETGFFYHPQWTKEEVDAKLTARSRHMQRAVGILSYFGYGPTYDTPNGDKGDGIKWDGTLVSDETATPASRLTGRLMYERSAAAAASMVRPTAAVAAHLQNDKTFIAYLEGLLTTKSSFYSIGSEIGQQETQILVRDQQLAAEGANYRLADILINFYSSHQNTETGLWDEGISYDNSDAILKIGGTYTTFGYVFPNADKAFESLIEILMSDEIPNAVVNVYNVWYAIGNLMENIEKVSTSAADKEYADAVGKRLLEMAPEAIKASADKQLLFKHPDGSFGYAIGQNCQTSSGVPVAPQGDGEGDVNASVICMSGTIGNCLRALGLKDYAPGYFTEADRLRYISILEDLGPVIKDDISVSVKYETFDADPLGNAPVNVEFSEKAHLNGQLTVVEKPGAEYGDYAMQINHYSTHLGGGYEVVPFLSQSGARNANCFVYESDIMVQSYGDNGENRGAATLAQLLIQPAVYMIGIETTDDGKVFLNEASSNTWSKAKYQDLGVRFEVGEWFNIKIEYYIGDHDTVRIKVFINGDLIAITDNYYDANGVKITGTGKPANTMDSLSFVMVSSATSEILVDNAAVYKSDAEYKRPTKAEDIPPICVDPLDKDELLFNFDDGNIPEYFTTVKPYAGQIGVEKVDGNYALKLSGSTSSNQKAPYITLPVNLRTGSAKVAIVQADITVSPDSDGRVQRFWFTNIDENKESAACFDLQVVERDGKKYTVVVEAPNGSQTGEIKGTEVELGTKFILRLEYFERERATLVYINGKVIGMSGAICKNGEKYPANNLVIQAPSGVPFDVTIDNLIFEKNVVNFREATASGADRVTHTFDALPEGAELIGGGEIKDGVLNIGSVGSGIKLPLVDRNLVTTASEVFFKAETNGTLASYVITFGTKDGDEIVCAELVISEDLVEIYEYYAGGRGSRIGTVQINVPNITVEAKFFYKEATFNIYINGTAAASTALTYLWDRDSLKPEYFSITQKSGFGAIKVDDSYTERTAGLYEALTGTITETPATEDTITFETSGLNNYPKAVTTKFAAGSNISVKAVLNGGAASKALALYTAVGNNDSVTFPLQDKFAVENATVFVLEADLMFDTVDGQSSGIQLFLRDPANKDITAMYYTIYADPGKEVSISDWNSGKRVGAEHKIGVMEEELFKFRLEYIVVDGKLTANFFINGKYLFTSDIFDTADKPIDASSIGKAMFYALNAANTTMYIDNVKVYQTKEITPITPAE